MPNTFRFSTFGVRLLVCCALVTALIVAPLVRPIAAFAQDASPTVVRPIGTNDVLHVDVVGQPDLSRDYTVDPDGNITMLYVGKLHVGGESPDQATDTIKGALGKIYVNPAVTVTINAYGGATITVTGAVQKQGSVTVRRDSRLNDIIQQALPATDADLTKIQITRGLPGEQHTTLTFDLADFLSNGTVTNNPALEDGDVIFVPNKAPVTYSVSIVGAISKPGRYDVQPGTTVYDLIKLAGGLDEAADHSSIYLQPIGTIQRTPFDYDKASQAPEDPNINPVLKDGDKVVIPEGTVPVISITGGVLKPGQYPIRGKLTLSDAFGLAGGLEDRAKVDQITITRESGEGAQVLKVNAKDPEVAATFLLQPGDNIVIPHGSPPNRIDPLQLVGIALALFGIFHH